MKNLQMPLDIVDTAYPDMGQIGSLSITDSGVDAAIAYLAQQRMDVISKAVAQVNQIGLSYKKAFMNNHTLYALVDIDSLPPLKDAVKKYSATDFENKMMDFADSLNTSDPDHLIDPAVEFSLNLPISTWANELLEFYLEMLVQYGISIFDA